MVFQPPKRPISVLLIARDRNEGSLLRIGIEHAMGDFIAGVKVVEDLQFALEIYHQVRPDVVIFLGLTGDYTEKMTAKIRDLDGKRHVGILVMAPVAENYDRLAVQNYNAGVDDVVSENLSTMILKSKIINIFNYKTASDELRTAVHALHKITLIDELTGLSNMRGFLKKYAQSLKQPVGGLAVVMMDLDHFKRINDSMNHLVGSHVIKSVGRLLSSNEFFKGEDFAARYGGDEFIIVLHGSDHIVEMKKADQIRKLIAASEFVFQDFKVRVTCSMGFCWVPANFVGKPEDVVKLADSMLYRSKDAGRDVVSAVALDAVGQATVTKIGAQTLTLGIASDLKRAG